MQCISCIPCLRSRGHEPSHALSRLLQSFSRLLGIEAFSRLLQKPHSHGGITEMPRHHRHGTTATAEQFTLHSQAWRVSLQCLCVFGLNSSELRSFPVRSTVAPGICPGLLLQTTLVLVRILVVPRWFLYPSRARRPSPESPKEQTYGRLLMPPSRLRKTTVLCTTSLVAHFLRSL